MALTGITKALAHLGTIPILSPGVLIHLSRGFLPQGLVALSLIMGPVDHNLLRPVGHLPDLHYDPIKIYHWVDPFIALPPPHCSSCKPQTGTLPDKGAGMAAQTVQATPFETALAPQCFPGMFLLLKAHLHISGSQTLAQRYWATFLLQNQARQT